MVFSHRDKILQQKDFYALSIVKSAKDLPVSRRFEPDDTDRAILRLIQHDAALSLADIAKEVGLTPTPCWKRIRRMEQEGVITGRVVGPILATHFSSSPSCQACSSASKDFGK